MPKKQTKQVESENPEKLRGKAESTKNSGDGSLWMTGLAVLGVVFGDIGTSPLYALQKCLSGSYAATPSPGNILGLLSLIFWSLTIVITIKYIAYVMRASNENEGGILALMALIEPAHPRDKSRRNWIILLGIFGAALLYGDGMITPAISVLSAVEGLKIVNPEMENFIIPVTIAILVMLFVFQKQGTSGVGVVFGPVMSVWFLALIATGLTGILQNPSVFHALNPVWAVKFLASSGINGFLVLGSVFLVVTGGEALYADIGHFGKKPVRLSWFILVMPALVVNYFGQGAVLLKDPGIAGKQIFFFLGPSWTLIPMVILATIATIIASQAIISASFSLTRQAVLLGYLPHLKIVQTSEDQPGQVYISGINWILMLATIGLVLGFKKSVNLAGAYGIAVSTTMVITTILMFIVAREKWKWPLYAIIPLTVVFLGIDLGYMASNMFKIWKGGFFPIMIALLVFLLMLVWRTGNARMDPLGGKKSRSVETFMKLLKKHAPERVSGTAVFLTANISEVSLLLMRQLEFFRVVNEEVILLLPEIMDVPKVHVDQRVEVRDLGSGIIQMTIKFGFMENPNIPSILRNSKFNRKKVDPEKIIYYIEYPRIVYGGSRGSKKFIAKIFSFMARNSANPVEFFRIPVDQVLEVGVRVHLR